MLVFVEQVGQQAQPGTTARQTSASQTRNNKHHAIEINRNNDEKRTKK